MNIASEYGSAMAKNIALRKHAVHLHQRLAEVHLGFAWTVNQGNEDLLGDAFALAHRLLDLRVAPGIPLFADAFEDALGPCGAASLEAPCPPSGCLKSAPDTGQSWGVPVPGTENPAGKNAPKPS